MRNDRHIKKNIKSVFMQCVAVVFMMTITFTEGKIAAIKFSPFKAILVFHSTLFSQFHKYIKQKCLYMCLFFFFACFCRQRA